MKSLIRQCGYNLTIINVVFLLLLFTESQSQEAVGGEDAILFEGWHKSWEAEDSGLPKQDLKWLKVDEERGLFLKPRPFSA